MLKNYPKETRFSTNLEENVTIPTTINFNFDRQNYD